MIISYTIINAINFINTVLKTKLINNKVKHGYIYGIKTLDW